MRAPWVFLLTGLLVAPGADAAPACGLLTDRRGDVEIGYVTPHRDDRVDLVAADLGNDARSLTAVIRVAGLDATAAHPGLHWHLEFDLRGTEYHVTAERLPDGDRFSLQRLLVVNPGDANVVNVTELQRVASATGSIDVARGEIRVTVPLTAFEPALRKRDTLTDVQAYAEVSPGTTATPGTSHARLVRDDADTTRTFVVGTPTCVARGR